jgi:2-polyprenyl-3-methyl-5-hydroxy-6-metoxy-1,4-benzoquinol methylase
MFKKELITSAINNRIQFLTRNIIVELIKKKKLNLIQYKCPISNNSNNIVLSNTDRYGLPIQFSYNKDSGLIYSNKSFDKKSFFKFYNLYYRKLYHGKVSEGYFFPKEIKRGKRLKKFLKKNNIKLNRNDFILEVGCGSGGILNEINHSNYLGIDLDRKLIDYGKKRGLNLEYCDLNHIDKFIKKKPRLIIFSHVLEHIIDLPVFFKKLKKIIENNTLIYIEVPDSLAKLKTLKSKYINELHLAHFTIFNKETLKNLLAKNQFSPLMIQNIDSNISGLFQLNRSFKKYQKNNNLNTYNSLFKKKFVEIDKKVKNKYPFYEIKIFIKYFYLLLKSKIC